ncbi:MAG: helix-turn-helix domain-containing protein, partial [Planctomycetota bacterium]
DGSRVLQSLNAETGADAGSDAAPPPLPPSPVLGRDDLLHRLSDRLVARAATCSALVGPPGAGMRRVAREAVHRMHDLGGGRRVIEVAALADDAGLPEGVVSLDRIRDVVRAESRLPGPAEAADLIDWLREVPSVLVLAVPPDVEWVAPDARQFVIALVTAVRLLAPSDLAVMLLVTTSDEAETAPEWLGKLDGLHVETIRPLPVEQFDTYVRATLRLDDAQKLPASWKPWTTRLAPGWPGLWRQALEAMTAAGAVRWAGGRWQLAEERDLADVPLPQRANRLARQLDALDADARTVLAAVALAGPLATRALAVDALGRSGANDAATRGPRAIEQLAAAGLLQEQRDGEAWRLTARVTDGLPTLTDRLDGGNGDNGDNGDRARGAILDAISAALDQNKEVALPAASWRALAALADALRRPADERRAWWLGASHASEAEQDATGALSALETAAVLAGESSADDDIAGLARHWKLTRALRKTRRSHEIAARLHTMLPRLQAAGAPVARELAECHEMLAGEEQRACNWDAGEQHLRTALDVLATQPATDSNRLQQVQCHISLAMVELGRARYDILLQHLDDAMQLIRLLPDELTSEVRGRALSVRGHVAWVRADYAAARDAYMQAAEVEGAAGSTRGQAISLSNVALMMHTLGDTAAAGTVYEQAEMLYRRLGMVDALGQLLNSRAHIALGRGEVSAARAMLQEALELTADRGDVQLEVSIICNIAAEDIEASAFDVAADALNSAAERIRDVSEPMIHGVVLDNLASLATEDGQLLDAADMLARSETYFAEGGLDFMVERGASRRASLLALAGDHSRLADALRAYAPPPPGARGNFNTLGDAGLWDRLARGLQAIGNGAWGVADLMLTAAVERTADVDRRVERRAVLPLASRLRVLQGELTSARELARMLRQQEGIEESALHRARLDLIGATIAWQQGDAAHARSLLRSAHRTVRRFDESPHGHGEHAHVMAVARLIGDDDMADAIAATGFARVNVLDWLTLLAARLQGWLTRRRDDDAVPPPVPSLHALTAGDDGVAPPELLRILQPLATGDPATLPVDWLSGLLTWAVRAPWPGLAWRIAGLLGRITGDAAWHDEARQTLDEIAIDLAPHQRPAFWQLPAHLAAVGEFELLDALADGGDDDGGDDDMADGGIGSLPTERGAIGSLAVGDLQTERNVPMPPDPARIANLPTERPAAWRSTPEAAVENEPAANDDVGQAAETDAVAAALPGPEQLVLEGGLDEAVTRYQRLLIASILERTGNNRSETARILGIERSRLYRLLKRLGL